MNPSLIYLKVLISAISLVSLLSFPLNVNASPQEAIFAGGCFWCLEHDFEPLKGVVNVESGYTGGDISSPSYRQVSAEDSGHKEAIKVLFDPDQISYEKLLRSYWRNIDPLDGEGQFCDRGDSYKPFIFTMDDQQKLLAKKSAESAAFELDLSLNMLKVQIQPASQFWPAEDYHQNYAERNSVKYNFYRFSCGRDSRLDQVWGDKARTSENWPD